MNAAGQWARQVGALAGVDLPIRPLQHQYLTTEPLDQLKTQDVELPVFAIREGPFTCARKVADFSSAPSNPLQPPGRAKRSRMDSTTHFLPPDIDRIEDVLAAVCKRIPAFESVGVKKVINGPDGYTPDGRCLLGPVPGTRNFHVLAGFSIFGIVFGGAAGQYAAEWIVDGQPSNDVAALDVRRFGDYAKSTRYVQMCASEAYAREYAIGSPYEELPAGRPFEEIPAA